MPIQDEILKLVPIGEANAVSSRLLWQQLDKWAASSVRGELHKMATRGLIQSKTERQGRNEVRVFFKRRGQDD